MQATPTVIVVDDDEAVRESLCFLIRSVDLHAEAYASAQEFLDGYDRSKPGCLVLDVRMPGMSGLELQVRMRDEQIHLPVVILTGHADVPMAVRALKAGAVDFVEKPFNEQLLLDCIQRALARDRDTRAWTQEYDGVNERVARLSPRERQVMEMVVAGKPNRVVAEDLGLSEKTIEVHRARVMSKMQARSIAELVRMAMLHEDGQSDPGV